MSKKKKILLIALGTPVVLLVLAVGAFALFFLPPSADAVCGKVLELSKKYSEEKLGKDATSKLSEKDLLGQTKAECAKSEETRASTKGIFKINDERRCIMNTNSLDKLTDCAKK